MRRVAVPAAIAPEAEAMVELLPVDRVLGVELGFILPGAALAAVTLGALTAPLGAGVAEPALPEAGPDMLIVPVPGLAGAMFPGEAPGEVTGGEATEPCGAGALVVALWAQAMPVVISKAVGASQIVFMIVSCLNEFQAIQYGLIWP